ncbi:hypothetical protein GUJ93_ZPchr0007g5354 [Zizania palustris]|uniref:Uncharacterized protein n=1 Tax=Zizania palustris TaxID=103762 RepID=A0A8J5VYS4_ZIZPA|nr:hypothetical protein GUJ93_ZPchr0007g5354 [Zizania palustris]
MADGGKLQRRPLAPHDGLVRQRLCWFHVPLRSPHLRPRRPTSGQAFAFRPYIPSLHVDDWPAGRPAIAWRWSIMHTLVYVVAAASNSDGATDPSPSMHARPAPPGRPLYIFS